MLTSPGSPCGLLGHQSGYFLHVLGGGGKQALPGDPDDAAEPGISVPVKLFGIGEGSFDGFLAAFVDRFPPRRQAMSLDAVAGILPDVAIDHALVISSIGAGGEQGALFALLRIGSVQTITAAIRRGIGQRLTFWAAINILMKALRRIIPGFEGGGR